MMQFSEFMAMTWSIVMDSMPQSSNANGCPTSITHLARGLLALAQSVSNSTIYSKSHSKHRSAAVACNYASNEPQLFAKMSAKEKPGIGALIPAPLSTWQNSLPLIQHKAY